MGEVLFLPRLSLIAAHNLYEDADGESNFRDIEVEAMRLSRPRLLNNLAPTCFRHSEFSSLRLKPRGGFPFCVH